MVFVEPFITIPTPGAENISISPESVNLMKDGLSGWVSPTSL